MYHTSTPTPLSVAGARDQHRCTPSWVDGPRSITKRETGWHYINMNRSRRSSQICMPATWCDSSISMHAFRGEILSQTYDECMTSIGHQKQPGLLERGDVSEALRKELNDTRAARRHICSHTAARFSFFRSVHYNRATKMKRRGKNKATVYTAVQRNTIVLYVLPLHPRS